MRQLLGLLAVLLLMALTSCSKKITPTPHQVGIEQFVPEQPERLFQNQYRSWAYVVSVYDGDTVTLLFQSGVNNWQLWKTRLLGIDAPEVRGKEKELGLATRNWLADKILGKWILVDTPEWDLDKYGRLLVNLHLPLEENIETPLNLNQEMIRLGLVKIYGKAQKEEFIKDIFNGN